MGLDVKAFPSLKSGSGWAGGVTRSVKNLILYFFGVVFLVVFYLFFIAVVGPCLGAPPPEPPALKEHFFSILVFGPEWVSYERSRRVRHAQMREILARVLFLKNTQKSVFMFLGRWNI